MSFELYDNTDVPCGGSIIRLCSVVVAFAVTTHVEHLVLRVAATPAVVPEDLMFKTLPLGLGVVGIIFAVGVVSSID